MCKSGIIELTGVDIRKFELYTRRGISAAYNAGGYEGAKACYEAETGRSFQEDLEKRGSIMKVKITNKKDKTDAYSLNLSKAFGVRRMGDALIVYYGGSDAMFSFH